MKRLKKSAAAYSEDSNLLSREVKEDIFQHVDASNINELAYKDIAAAVYDELAESGKLDMSKVDVPTIVTEAILEDGSIEDAEQAHDIAIDSEEGVEARVYVERKFINRILGK